ncbi:MAG: CaiB/BaiF CoA-transferase family protein [Acidobacteriota bacterium]
MTSGDDPASGTPASDIAPVADASPSGVPADASQGRAAVQPVPTEQAAPVLEPLVDAEMPEDGLAPDPSAVDLATDDPEVVDIDPSADADRLSAVSVGADSGAAPSASADSAAAGPLDGLRVVDLSRYLPGPLVSRLLADLGARVLKVEEPKLGDPSRQAPPLVEGRSSLATLLLAGHESLAVDLKKPLAREVLDELLDTADVLVESFRPGVLASFGLAPRDLRRRFPRLVICSVTGFGQDGPAAARAGHDLTYQAVAGALAGGTGMPATQTADIVGAWSALSATLAALWRRERSGEGCHVDQALLDAAGHSVMTAWAAEADGEKSVGQPLYLTGAIPCYDLYRTRDDKTLALAALEPKFWKRFCDAVGRRDLLLRQFSRKPEHRRTVAELIASRTRDAWQELMIEHDIPAEPVLSLAEALEHPQVRHRGLLRRGADGLARLGFPALLDGRRPRGDDGFPEIGQHTESVLHELGVDAGRSAGQLRRGGIGQRFSWRRLATRVATAVVTRRQAKD